MWDVGCSFFLVGVWRGIGVCGGLDVVGIERRLRAVCVSAYPGSTGLNRKHQDEKKVVRIE